MAGAAARDHRYDVVVLGTGTAGLTAAVRAAADGARVGLFERAEEVGGTSAWSGGVAWLPNNRHEAEAGFADSRDEVLTYLESLSHGLIERPMIEAFADTAPEVVDWLEANTLGLYAAGNAMGSIMGMTYGGHGGTLGPDVVLALWPVDTRRPEQQQAVTAATAGRTGAANELGETRPFRFSVQAFEAGSGRQWTDLARRAEDLGYSTLFTTDHYFGPGDIAEASGHRPVDVAPLTAMTAAAMATTQLRVGCRVFCADYHNPVILAKETATLDMLSEGRVEVGLGAGWVAAEYEGLGIPMERPGLRIERLAETVEVLRAHWAGEPLDIERTFVWASGFAGRPRPVQQPHPPIFIGGGGPARAAAGRPTGRYRKHQLQQRGRQARSGQRGSPLDPGRHRGEDRLDPGGRGRPVRGPRAGDRRLLHRDQRRSGRRGSGHGPAVRRDPGSAGRASARAYRLGARDLRQARRRRSELGVSYVNVAQRSMEAFAPVVARLAGELITARSWCPAPPGDRPRPADRRSGAAQR